MALRAHRQLSLILVVLCASVVAMLCMSAPALATRQYIPAGSFGTPGAGNGQLDEPTAIAVDDSLEPLVQPAAGDVYVMDNENARIERFSSTGAYISQWDGSETPAHKLGFAHSRAEGGAPQDDVNNIAVDNSPNPMDPSAGDVYVVSEAKEILQFTAEGKYTGLDLTGTCAAPGTCPGEAIGFNGEVHGIGVDSSGDLWVTAGPEADEFSDTGAFMRTVELRETHGEGTFPGLGVAANGDLYAMIGERLHKFDEGENVAELGSPKLIGAPGGAVAVSQGSGDVLFDTGSGVELFAPVTEGNPAPLENFPGEGVSKAESLSQSDGLAVNGADAAQTAYVSELETDDVRIFRYVLVPTVITGRPTATSGTVATLHGSVNPEGEAIDECRFEYATEEEFSENGGKYTGGTSECEPNASAIGEGSEPVAVSGQLSGLLPLTVYHFRLTAANANGVKSGKDETFDTTAKPEIEASTVSRVESTQATLTAQVKPGGLPTTIRVEFGASSEYGSLSGEVSAGAGLRAASVQIPLSGLQPGVLYHARVVASNELGGVAGEDLTFTTLAAVGATTSDLPDGRAYELVSTANQADVDSGALGHEVKGQTVTHRPFRASPDGNAIVYLGEPPAKGGSGSQGVGEEYLGRRTSNGWADTDIVPPGATGQTKYLAFSNDLATGVLTSEGLNDPETTSAAPCDPFFTRSEDGRLHAFFTEQVSVPSCAGGENAEPAFLGASADYSHLLFESQGALTEGAEEASGQHEYNLYDAAGGRLRQVNILPGLNPEPDPNATFGGPHNGVGKYNNPAGNDNAISADGSRIFWTDRNTDNLYLRENDTRTIPISLGDSRFWTATPDGKYVYYTEGEESEASLWRFDVDTYDESSKPEAEALAEAREQITPAGSGALGVMGINETGEDGAYVYFVAEGALAGNEGANGEKAAEGSPNLYVRSHGTTSFIGTLTLEDNELHGPLEDNSAEIGDWQHNLGDRTSEVTPDGRAIGFLSHAKLTGYGNQGATELYVYHADTGQMWCASCDSSGAPPLAEAVVVPVTDSAEPGGATYMERWLSEGGNRVLFDDKQSLLPQVSDGRWNVYEWELGGTGSCSQGSGCTYVLSGGRSPDDSFLVDASANGSDVFFTSREDFVPQAHGESNKLYDARVGGGFPVVTTACTGTGCQGVPPAPPPFATPATVTFTESGNFQPTQTAAKPKPKPTAAQIRAGKLARALKRCAKRPRRKRAACRRQAKRKYAPTKKKGGKR